MTLIERIHALAPLVGSDVANALARQMEGAAASAPGIDAEILAAIASAVRKHGAAGMSLAVEAITEALGEEPDFSQLFGALEAREASDLMVAFQSAEIGRREDTLRWLDVFARLSAAVILAILGAAS